jgi:myo-inositol-1-phosphate synthase
VQEHLGWFFKAPMTRDGAQPEHALHRQEQALLTWLADGSGAVVDPYPTGPAADGRVGQFRA